MKVQFIAASEVFVWWKYRALLNTATDGRADTLVMNDRGCKS